MSRMDTTFARLRERGERALMPYFTAGDPSLAETRRLVAAAERAGADSIELGVPFSDPIADGPVVQRAGTRALAAGASLPRVLELVAGLRADGVKLPIALMTYYNPVLAFGLKSFARTAIDVGADAVIVPDLPYEECDPLRAEAEPAGLDYPGVGPEHAYYREAGRFEFVAITDEEALDGFQALTKLEGIMPALESAHAVAHAMRLAKTMPRSKTIVVGLSSRGDKDVHVVAKALGKSIE